MPADLAALISTVGTFVPWLLVLAYFLADDVPTRLWGIAFAWFLSYPADILGSHLALAESPNGWVVGLLAPIQFSLMAWALSHPSLRGWVVVGTMLGCVVAGVPLWLLQSIGGLGVAWLAAPYKARRAIWLYCVGPIPGLIFLGVVSPYQAAWLWVWAATQIIRWAAIGWLAWEVARGSRYHQNTAANSRSGRPHRPLWMDALHAAPFPAQKPRG